MSDNVNSASESGQQPSADPSDIDVSNIPDNIPTEDVRGLKSAFEKLKAQVAELKPLQGKAAIVDQLVEQGIKAEDIPARLAAIQEQQKAQAETERLIAEQKAKAKAEQDQLSQEYQGKISELTQQINAQKQRNSIEAVLATGGGSMADYADFAAIARRYIEFNDDQTIKGFKAVDGQTLFVEDEKQIGKVRPATVQDFVVKAKSGEYGKALQSILPPLNQSSGSGLPGSVGGDANGKVVLTQAQIDRMGEMSSEELAQIRKRGYVVVG